MRDLQEGHSQGFAPHLLESGKGSYFLRIVGLVFVFGAAYTCVVLLHQSAHAVVWDGLFLVLQGLFVLFRFGLTKEPLYYFDELTFREKSISVLAARLTYIPFGLYVIYFGLEVLTSALK